MRHRLMPLFTLLLLAAVPAFAVPAVGVDAANNLITFDTAAPAATTTVPVTGLNVGETILGLDYRPATDQLFALGSAGRLYTINPATGAATFVAALSVSLSGTAFGVDFNPTVDRLRITSDADQNLRVVPGTGAVTMDLALQYAAGDPNAAANPNVTASAYTNSFSGATSTTLYGIDTNLDILVTQNPPNNGTLNTVGALGVNASNLTGFDILSGPAGPNSAFAAIQTGAGTSIYSINLTTGAASLIGAVGAGTTVLNAFAIVPATADIPTLSTMMMLLMAATLVAVGAMVIKR